MLDNTESATALIVRAYCIPYAATEHVYKSNEWQITDYDSFPLGELLDRQTSDSILRVCYSVPYGDHVIILSETNNYVSFERNEQYVSAFQHLTVWRADSELRMHRVADAATVIEECVSIITSLVDEPDFTDSQITRAKITDFVTIVSEEYTIDLVLSLDVTVLLFDAESLSPPITKILTMYVRLGFCEYLPETFTGNRREPEPLKCAGVWSSRTFCEPLSQELGSMLFQQWLADGNLMYAPLSKEYFWLPSARTATSVLPSILPVNISLSENRLRVDLHAPAYFLTGNVRTVHILGEHAYWQNARRASSGRYTPLRNSPVGHWRLSANGTGSANETVLQHQFTNANSLWYTAATETVARSWLQDVRYDRSMLSLTAHTSTQQTVTIEVVRYCDGHTCTGCSTLRLRQICSALEMCMLNNCMGSLVNHGDLLCNAGMLLESLYSQSVALYVAVWHMVVSILISGMETQSHSQVPHQFRAEWASDVVNSLLCELKDIHAAATGFLATLMHRGSSSSGTFALSSDSLSFDMRASKQVNTEAYSRHSLETAAWHQFFYQATLVPIYGIFGAHRWLMCSITDVVKLASNNKFQLSLGASETGEDGIESSGSWAYCSSAATLEQILTATGSPDSLDKLASIVNDIMLDEVSLDNLANGVLPFDPLDLFLHLFDAAVAYVVGVLTGVQDIMYNSDGTECQISDIAVKDAVLCACGDDPAAIVPERRRETFASGALWCSGTLYVAFDDGVFDYVFNPYSLDELGAMLEREGMKAYLECISSSANDGCVQPQIAVFSNIGVNPMTILARCRANYVQRQWDIGATVLFDPSFVPSKDLIRAAVKDAREVALGWAKGAGQQFHDCVVETAGTNEFGACLDIYLTIVQQSFESGQVAVGARSETYFAYRVLRASGGNEEKLPAPSDNPDACVVFSGPARLAESETDRLRFQQCLQDSPQASAKHCSLNPLAWSGRLQSRTPIITVHRDVVSDERRREDVRDALYQEALDEITAAFEKFDAKELDEIDAMFFTAEGDVLHQMLDCMFLGPYARVEYVVGDKNANLPPLEWFRDNRSGTSRDFDLPCTGPKLHGDGKGTPYTCGSPARRAVIKKYVRDYMFRDKITGEKQSIKDITAREILERLQTVRASFTNPSNYACKGDCGDPLHGHDGWKPDLPDFGEVNESALSEAVFASLPVFFRDALMDASIWTTYYTDTETPELWGKWSTNPAAREYHAFAPNEPIISYNESEVFDTFHGDSFKNSVWGICASLIAQPMSTMPLVQYSEDWSGFSDASLYPAWMPAGIRSGKLLQFDSFRADGQTSENAVHEWVDQLLEEAWLESPMYMHYVTRYVPSMSMVCEEALVPQQEEAEDMADEAHQIRMTDGYLLSENNENEAVGRKVFGMDALEMRFRGYSQHTLGTVLRHCPCGLRGTTEENEAGCSLHSGLCSAVLAAQTRFDNQTLHAIQVLVDVCSQATAGIYPVRRVPEVLEALFHFDGGVGCMEFELSDTMGMFPLREDDAEWNRQWTHNPVTSASRGKIDYDPMNGLARLSMGITAANVKHVQREMKDGRGWSESKRTGPLAKGDGAFVAQRVCSKPGSESSSETVAFPDDLVDDFLDALFPVAQLVLDESPSLSACTRFLIERLKLHFMRHIIQSPNTQKQAASVARWQKRCDLKARQTSVCNELRILELVPLRATWEAGLVPSCRNTIDVLDFDNVFGSESYYITPSCVLFAGGNFYELYQCLELNGQVPVKASESSVLERCRMHDSPYADSALPANPRTFNPLQLSPLGFGTGRSLDWGDGGQFSEFPEMTAIMKRIQDRAQAVKDSAFETDLSESFVHAVFGNVILPYFKRTDAYAKKTEPFVTPNTDATKCENGVLWCEDMRFCDRAFDWWPDNWTDPVGYHPTATCSRSENAYRTFDSYLSMNRDTLKLVYEHTGLRDSDLHYQWLGAAGLCRLPSVKMPLMQSNTHRVCTQMPQTFPNPALPKSSQFANMKEIKYTDEACSSSAQDTPWQRDTAKAPMQRVVGGVSDFLRVSSEYRPALGRLLTTPRYPSVESLSQVLETLKLPLSFSETKAPEFSSFEARRPVLVDAGIQPAKGASDPEPWGSCMPRLEEMTCDVRDGTSCPDGMRCIQLPGVEVGSGVCLVVGGRQRAGRPCFRSDMCTDSSHCLADGVCGKVTMHLWNAADTELEFTTLAKGGCGKDTEKKRPYTQDFQGASPWETVPDILQAHGLCSSRHMYSYRYAMAHGVLASAQHQSVVLKTRRGDNTPAWVDWPWIQQSFSGVMVDEETRLTAEGDRRVLHMHPHVCDRSFMHLPDFAVCSGARGDPVDRMPMYNLKRLRQSGGDPLLHWVPEAISSKTLNITHWMRTMDPSDATHTLLSTVFNETSFLEKGQFSFLGGDLKAPVNSPPWHIAKASARFSACVNIETCGKPEFQYAGKITRRRLKYEAIPPRWVEITVEDYRSCGSIGYLRGPSSNECSFDLMLFPHIRLLATGSSPFCLDIFQGLDSVLQVLTNFEQPCPDGFVCCHGNDNPTPMKCKYLAIGSSSTGRMLFSSYVNMIEKLNAIHTLVTIPEATFHERESLGVASSIAECVTDLFLTNEIYQSAVKAAYNSSSTSGLYHVLNYHLKETPLLWYYKWVYKTLIWTRTLSLVNLLSISRNWQTSINIGEAWESRSSLSQDHIKRCSGQLCDCQRSDIHLNMRDQLLCLNGAARLRIDDSSTSGSSRWTLTSDAFGTYMTELRERIRADVMQFVKCAYGDISKEAMGHGCYTEAFWKRETCFAEEYLYCAEFLWTNASSEEPVTDRAYDFDVRKSEFQKFFDPRGWTTGVTDVNLVNIVDKIVSSYEFIDTDFDPLIHGELKHSNEKGWEYPLFKLRREPSLTTEFDNFDDNIGHSTFVTPVNHQDESLPGRQCVFTGDEMDNNEAETLFEDSTFERPIVILSDNDPDEFGAHSTFFDICDSEDGTSFLSPVGLSGETERMTHMSCSFRDSAREMGHDRCDTNGVATNCFFKTRIVNLETDWDKVYARVGAVKFHAEGPLTGMHTYVSEGQTRIVHLKAVQGSIQCGHAIFMGPFPQSAQEEEDIGYELFRDIVRNHLLNGGAKSASASSAPTMACSDTPYHTRACLNTGLSQQAYEGNWQMYGYFSRYSLPMSGLKKVSVDGKVPAIYDTITPRRYSFEDDGLSTKTGWYGNREQVLDDFILRMFNNSAGNAQSQIAEAMARAAEAYYEKDQTTSKADWHYFSFQVPCMITMRTDAKENPDERDKIPQRQPRNGMCHRLDTVCIPPKDRDAFIIEDGRNGVSRCKLRHATLPPGVAGRFYSISKPPSEWLPPGGHDPAWEVCPDTTLSEAEFNGVKVPVFAKANPKHYPRVFEKYGTVQSCTKQKAVSNFGQCGTEEKCFIVNEKDTSEWSLKHSESCAGMSGACSFSLTLGEGFFCGTGSMKNGKRMPPSFKCKSADERKILVRGDFVERRSLWRCAKCIMYNPRQYTGRFMCGFRAKTATVPKPAPGTCTGHHEPPAAIPANFQTRDLVANVKKYIKEHIHSLPNLLRLHEGGTSLEYNGDPSQPSYNGDGLVAYAELKDLPFASSFKNWEPSVDGECKDGLKDGENVENIDEAACSWRGVYDVGGILKEDEDITAQTSILSCSTNVPTKGEYQTCSAYGGNDHRKALREWVEKTYQKALGTWMPVLPAQAATKWTLDRSSTSNPFTVMVASHTRAVSQKHIRYVLGDEVCGLGSHLESVCLVTRNADAYHVNPWVAGEFNPSFEKNTVDSDNHVMGVDQCRRSNGEWQACCSCFPGPRCCYPAADCSGVTTLDSSNLFSNANVKSQCDSLGFRTPPEQPIEPTHATNVCNRKPLKTQQFICTHLQATLGNSDSARIESIDQLYHDQAIAAAAYFVEDFLVDADPALWVGKSIAHSKRYVPGLNAMLRMPDNILYPSHIVLLARASSVRSQILNVKALQMRHNRGELFSEELLRAVENWGPSLSTALWNDYESVVLRLYPHLRQTPGSDASSVRQNWDCPLRMVSFWGRDTPGFNPIVPDPVRSDFMFRGKFYCKDGDARCARGVHPYHGPESVVGIRDFHTTNGVCMFTLTPSTANDDGGQTKDALSIVDTCSLIGHITALLDGQWRTSNVPLTAASACSEILDWPAYPLNFRSGEKHEYENMKPSSQSCALLDRLPPYRLKFKTDAPLTPHPDKTTSDEGGDCHMGRATRISNSEKRQLLEYEHCVTVARTSTQASVRCSGYRGNAEGRAGAADRLFVLQREVRLKPREEIVDSPSPRQSCSECDAGKIPFVGPDAQELPFGETSVGEMRRFSTERLLARMLAKECDATDGCTRSTESWSKDVFLKTLLGSPARLVVEAQASLEKEGSVPRTFLEEIEESVQPPVEDSVLWQHNWVLSNNGYSYGTASKADWQKNRYGACWNIIKQEIEADVTGTFVRPISFCDVTGSLSDLCTSLRNALATIERANCVGKGDDCEILSSFYSPSQWFTGNKVFARETVRDFYKFSGNGTCIEQDDRIAAATKENNLVKESCMATYIEIIKDGMQMLRLIARILVASIISVFSLVVDFFMFVVYSITGRDTGPLVGDMMFHIEKLIELIVEGMNQMLNMLLYLIATISDLGSIASDIAYWICKIVMLVKKFVVELFMCGIIRTSIWGLFEFLDKIVGVFEAIKAQPAFGWILKDMNLKPWNDFKSDVDSFIDAMPCKTEVSWKSMIPVVALGLSEEDLKNSAYAGGEGCELPLGNTDYSSYGHAFLASRCWTNPSHGNLFSNSDANSLGCAASDTCQISALDTELLNCESCPAVDVEYFIRFGCDQFLKKCRCAVPLSASRPCTSNGDCNEHIQCALRFSPYATAYGTFDCLDSCRTQPTCLITETATNGIPPAGECTCLMDPPEIATCDTAGVLVNLAVQNGLCYFARSSTLENSIGLYKGSIIQQSELTLVPCELLNKNEQDLTCQSVQYASGAIKRHIVGSALVSYPEWGAFQRRLLWAQSNLASDHAWDDLMHLFIDDESVTWQDTGSCGDLVVLARAQHEDAIWGPFSSNSSAMSVGDRQALKHCLKWRAVANASLGMHNISDGVLDDRIFLSFSSFVSMMSHEMDRIITNPTNNIITRGTDYWSAAFYAMSQIDAMVPFFGVLRKGAIILSTYWSSAFSEEHAVPVARRKKVGRKRSLATNRSNMTLAQKFPSFQGLNWTNISEIRSALVSSKYEAAFEILSETAFDKSELWWQNYHHPSEHGRTLKLARDPEAGWPVDWSEFIARAQQNDNAYTCDLYDIAKESISTAVSTALEFYENGYHSRENMSNSLRDNLMRSVPKNYSKNNTIQRSEFLRESQEGVPRDGFIDITMEWAKLVISTVTGFNEENVILFFDPQMNLTEQIEQDLFTLERIVDDLTRCNFKHVMLCDMHPKSLVPSVIICLFFIWLLSQMLWLSSGFTFFILAAILPTVILWYVYGYSPQCIPLIPTCFMHDFVVSMKETFPVSIKWPALLIKQDICSLDGVPYGNHSADDVNCFESCGNEQFRFRSFLDPFAWFLCEIDGVTCIRFTTWLRSYTSFAYGFHDTALFFNEVIALGNPHATHAYRVCAFLTGYYIIPALLFVIWFFFMSALLTKAGITLGFKTLVFVIANLSMTARGNQ